MNAVWIRVSVLVTLAITALCPATGAQARDGGSELVISHVPAAYAAIAREYDVPAGLLYAVGRAESNLRGVGRPWPWTLNVRGTSLYFATKQEAANHLTSLLHAGEQMVDVGLMQVNWYWHKDKLVDPDTALSPYFNLRVGAAYLREQYDRSGDWFTAIGRYHNPSDSARATTYARGVLAHWRRISE